MTYLLAIMMVVMILILWTINHNIHVLVKINTEIGEKTPEIIENQLEQQKNLEELTETTQGIEYDVASLRKKFDPTDIEIASEIMKFRE